MDNLCLEYYKQHGKTLLVPRLEGESLTTAARLASTLKLACFWVSSLSAFKLPPLIAAGGKLLGGIWMYELVFTK